MPVLFNWDEHNLKHVLEHPSDPTRNNSVSEVEGIILNPQAVIEELGVIDGELRFTAVAPGLGGILKRVVYTYRGELIRPITCYPVKRRFLKRYHGKFK